MDLLRTKTKSYSCPLGISHSKKTPFNFVKKLFQKETLQKKSQLGILHEVFQHRAVAQEFHTSVKAEHAKK